jgi:hypothetical protein
MVSSFGAQNQTGFRLSIAPENRQEDEDDTGLLRMEVSQASVSQSGLKTGGGVTVGGPRCISWKSCEDQVEDRQVDAMGYIGLCYPYLSIFFILGTRGILAF